MKNKKQKYVVYINDNFKAFSGEPGYEYARFDDYEQAKEACQKIIEESFNWEFQTGLIAQPNKYHGAMTVGQVYGRWKMFGEYPVILCDDKNCDFCAADYAEELRQRFNREMAEAGK